MMRSRCTQNRAAERGAAMISIRSSVGFVIARGRSGYEAFNAAERSLGVFATKDAAIRELIALVEPSRTAQTSRKN
jgi:hypothetical protein